MFVEAGREQSRLQWAETYSQVLASLWEWRVKSLGTASGLIRSLRADLVRRRTVGGVWTLHYALLAPPTTRTGIYSCQSAFHSSRDQNRRMESLTQRFSTIPV